ncbi:MAG: ureidoglycolate lyase [Betaproteobacteria bacterium]|nr:ureidoglycolate lyase [Betaproteobacteria bacterium]
MKLLTFRPARARSGHFGVLLAGNRILDISALPGRKLPVTLLECIQNGDAGLAAVKAAVNEAEAALQRGEQLAAVFKLDDVTLEAPLLPGKILAVGKNYTDHASEISEEAYTRVAGFVKLTSCVVPHGATIRKPTWTETFDYENELAIVIGRECADVAADNAYDCVFGYTIMNDLSCRDVQFAERKEGNICIGKNFPTAAPLGPWIVTKDEISDPHNLRIVTRVNGELRQDSNSRNQIYKIPAQIAWYSHAGLEPGDIISSGSPAGTGVGYKGPGTWYLQNGDEIECEIEGIGTLANTVSTRKRRG